MNYFIGNDVSKETLDIAVVSSEGVMLEKRIANEARCIRQFVLEFCEQRGVDRKQLIICLEHTGMYANILLAAALKLDLKICIESPLQIQKSQGIVRGKSDHIDARRIAQYAFKNQSELRFWRPNPPILQKVQALLVLRDRLIKVKSQLEVPLRESAQYIDQAIVRTLNVLSKGPVKQIKQSIKKLESEIDDLIDSDATLWNQCNHATSVPGIGKITALSMIIASGGFQKIPVAKKFSCYAGTAPFVYQSGTSIKGRTRVSVMANMSVKKLLHMAALSAVRYNPELRSFYERKVAEGKNKMSVLNAVRNKLISRVYACVKQDRMYEKNHQTVLL